MSHDIVESVKNRYTTKVYDPTRKISDEDMQKVRALLRFSPSSTNLQPWHFVIASTIEGKARVADSTREKYPFNTASIENASHVVVFASRVEADNDYLLHILAQEEADGRYTAAPEFKPRMHEGRTMFVNIHKQDLNDEQHWMEKQTYLNLGAFLLGLSALGIDATPMEGIDTQVLDDSLGLTSRGYASLVVVPIGYADKDHDYNASLPKSRLPLDEIITEI